MWDVRESGRMLLAFRETSTPSWCRWRWTWRSQRLLDPENQCWVAFKSEIHPPVDWDQGDRVLLVDRPDGGDASHRVRSHYFLVAARSHNVLTERERVVTWGRAAHRGRRCQLQGKDPDADKVLIMMMRRTLRNLFHIHVIVSLVNNKIGDLGKQS